ncbi:SPOR domain-containing protein [Methylocystis parvus]|uniref:SPOR domain-containing protein n=1 Tax=Methylocystis parvus TaxID=134 RepID=A0A6B8M5F5_9HYPH|nr:SPOR domain-containing protein [Methylocystis parvus]QGM99214.1 SPOR domain-containing protein [Methylocystis parvus]WBK00405.1 SPOR domain-containing protein [Methylocystis parvus OBBP]
MRESSVRGPAIDLSEFERRMRGGEAPKAAPKADPLSELARLMQGEQPEADPFGELLPDPRAQRAVPPPTPEWDAHLRGSYDAAPEVRHHDEPQRAHYAESDAAYQDQAYDDSQRYADQQYDPAYHGGAEGGWGDDSQYLDYGAEEEPEAQRGGVRKFLRPWHAVAAVAVVAVGSIAWGFMHRNGGSGSKEIAIINAPEGPVKVKPTAEADQEAPNANGAAVLDRKDPTPVKQIVTHQEQAVDPTVAPKVVKLGNGPVDAPHEPALGAQPKKVKTVTVRPDGSRVEDAAPPAMAKNAAPADPALAKGATPKPDARTATTPAAKPKPAPKVAAVEPPPPAADAAAPASPAGSSTGGYAVQFGAANSEEEARTLLKTVSAKYGVKATFKPAKVGDKTVYRVRVAGVSKDSANAICNKVKAAGGNCFVAGN